MVYVFGEIGNIQLNETFRIRIVSLTQRLTGFMLNIPSIFPAMTERHTQFDLPATLINPN